MHILNLSELTEIPLTELERLHSMEELHELIASGLAQISVSIHDDALRILRVLREEEPELALSEDEESFRDRFFQQLVRNPKLQRQFEALDLTASSLDYELVLTSERVIPFRKADHLYEDQCTRKHELRKFLDLPYAHPPNITYHVKNGDLIQSTTIRLSIPEWVKDERSIKKYFLTIQKTLSQ